MYRKHVGVVLSILGYTVHIGIYEPKSLEFVHRYLQAYLPNDYVENDSASSARAHLFLLNEIFPAYSGVRQKKNLFLVYCVVQFWLVY